MSSSVGKLFVGNLPWTATEDELKDFFSEIGEVISAKIIVDRETGKSKGFGFVEMENAKDAILALNEKPMGGRNIAVKEAVQKPKKFQHPAY